MNARCELSIIMASVTHYCLKVTSTPPPPSIFRRRIVAVNQSATWRGDYPLCTWTRVAADGPDIFPSLHSRHPASSNSHNIIQTVARGAALFHYQYSYLLTNYYHVGLPNERNRPSLYMCLRPKYRMCHI